MDYERFQALMSLADFHFRRRNARQEFEWKVSFGIWTLLAGATVTVQHRPPELPFIFFLVLLTVAHSFIWIGQVTLRNGRDMEAAFHFVAKAENEVTQQSALERPKPPLISDVPWRTRWFGSFRAEFWTIGLPSLVTILLAITTYFLMAGGPHGPPPLADAAKSGNIMHVAPLESPAG